MWGIIQNGYGLFGTGQTKALAIIDAQQWADNPIQLGEDDGQFTFVPLLEVVQNTDELDWDAIKEIAGNDGFDYNDTAQAFYSMYGDDWVEQDFCDQSGKSWFYLKQKPVEL